MQRIIYQVSNFCGESSRKIAITFLTLGLFFTLQTTQAQGLYDLEVNLTRVEWAGDLWCGDGVGTHVPPLPAVCVDLGNGVDVRYRYRVGADGQYPESDAITQFLEDAILDATGINIKYKHLGASNSPTAGGPVLEDESDTDGANVNSPAHNVALTNVCANGNITFDLDAWEEDAGFESIPCPLTANFEYNNDYDFLCNVSLDGGDDSRSKTTMNIAVPGLGTNNVTTTFGNFVMKWQVVATSVEAPTLAYADNSVCSGAAASFVANPSTIGTREYAWLDANNNILHVGDEFTTGAITSFPATFKVAQHNNGCVGATTNLVVTQSTANCGQCVAPDFLYAYNIDFASLSLGWNAVPNAIKYQMEGSPKGLRFIKCTKTTTTNGVQATGMFPFLTYEFRVRTDCPSTGWSAWSGYEEFVLNPFSTSAGRLPGDLLSPDELEEVRFDVSSIFVVTRDADARTITVGYHGAESLDEGQLLMTDVAGRQIYKGDFDITPANVKQIQTGDISDGIYFVSLYKDGILVETEKVLVY